MSSELEGVSGHDLRGPDQLHAPSDQVSLLHGLFGHLGHLWRLHRAGGQLVEGDGRDESEAGIAQHIGAQIVRQDLRGPFCWHEL